MWQELSENLARLASLYRSESFFPQFQLFLRRIYKRQMERLGWHAGDNESARTRTLRATVIGIMARTGEEAVLKRAFDIFMETNRTSEAEKIPGDLQRTVMLAAMRYNEASVFQAAKEMFERGDSLPEEQRNCLLVMGCVSDKVRHEEVLEYVLFSGRVRLQDISFPLSSLSQTSDEGGLATWLYFKRNYDRLHARFGKGPMWAACVGLSCRGLTTTSDADDVESFFKDRELGSAQRRLSQNIEVVRTQVARRDRDRRSLTEYFG